MNPELVIDESVDYRIVDKLIKESYSVFSIAKQKPGISDREVLKIALNRKGILLTEDADFGEWIFVHKVSTSGVIFLRYKSSDVMKIVSALVTTYDKYREDLYGKFIVITPKKMRIRKI